MAVNQYISSYISLSKSGPPAEILSVAKTLAQIGEIINASEASGVSASSIKHLLSAISTSIDENKSVIHISAAALSLLFAISIVSINSATFSKPDHFTEVKYSSDLNGEAIKEITNQIVRHSLDLVLKGFESIAKWEKNEPHNRIVLNAEVLATCLPIFRVILHGFFLLPIAFRRISLDVIALCICMLRISDQEKPLGALAGKTLAFTCMTVLRQSRMNKLTTAVTTGLQQSNIATAAMINGPMDVASLIKTLSVIIKSHIMQLSALATLAPAEAPSDKSLCDAITSVLPADGHNHSKLSESVAAYLGQTFSSSEGLKSAQRLAIVLQRRTSGMISTLRAIVSRETPPIPLQLICRSTLSPSQSLSLPLASILSLCESVIDVASGITIRATTIQSAATTAALQDKNWRPLLVSSTSHISAEGLKLLTSILKTFPAACRMFRSHVSRTLLRTLKLFTDDENDPSNRYKLVPSQQDKEALLPLFIATFVAFLEGPGVSVATSSVTSSPETHSLVNTIASIAVQSILCISSGHRPALPISLSLALYALISIVQYASQSLGDAIRFSIEQVSLVLTDSWFSTPFLTPNIPEGDHRLSGSKRLRHEENPSAFVSTPDVSHFSLKGSEPSILLCPHLPSNTSIVPAQDVNPESTSLSETCRAQVASLLSICATRVWSQGGQSPLLSILNLALSSTQSGGVATAAANTYLSNPHLVVASVPVEIPTSNSGDDKADEYNSLFSAASTSLLKQPQLPATDDTSYGLGFGAQVAHETEKGPHSLHEAPKVDMSKVVDLPIVDTDATDGSIVKNSTSDTAALDPIAMSLTTSSSSRVSDTDMSRLSAYASAEDFPDF